MTKGNVTVSIFVKPDGGYHWMLWQDTDCVGESESTVPDFIRVEVDGEKQTIPVVQYWCDPRFPDAHRAPAIREFMRRRAAEGLATLVRFSERKALIIFAPQLTGRDDWYETDGANVLAPGMQITATGETVPRLNN